MLNKLYKQPYVWLIVGMIVFPFIPYVRLHISLMVELIIFIIFALSFNLCLSHAGMASFGHGAFFGLGSYGAAISYIRLFNRSGFLLPVLIGVLVSTVAAVLFGMLVRNKKGIQFALLTVVFTQVLFGIAWRWIEVTGGEDGLINIKRHTYWGLDFSNPRIYYYLVFLIFVICFFVIKGITESSYGKTLNAIRQNPVRTSYLGYKNGLIKVSVYAISAAFGGLAGALHTFFNQAAFSDVLHWSKSGDVVIATVFGGGFVNFYGPILGSFIFLMFREVFSMITAKWPLLYGSLFVVTILTLPDGILGIFLVDKATRKANRQKWLNRVVSAFNKSGR